MGHQVHSKKREGVSGPTGEARSSALGLRKATGRPSNPNSDQDWRSPESVSALIQSNEKSRVDSD